MVVAERSDQTKRRHPTSSRSAYGHCRMIGSGDGLASHTSTRGALAPPNPRPHRRQRFIELSRRVHLCIDHQLRPHLWPGLPRRFCDAPLDLVSTTTTSSRPAAQPEPGPRLWRPPRRVTCPFGVRRPVLLSSPGRYAPCRARQPRQRSAINECNQPENDHVGFRAINRMDVHRNPGPSIKTSGLLVRPSGVIDNFRGAGVRRVRFSGDCP